MDRGFPQNPGFGAPFFSPTLEAAANPFMDPTIDAMRQRLAMRDRLSEWSRFIEDMGSVPPPSLAAASRSLSSPTATGTATSNGDYSRYTRDMNGNTSTTINIDKSGGTAISDQSGGNGNRGRGAGNGGYAGGPSMPPPRREGRPDTAPRNPALPPRGQMPPQRDGGRRPDTGGRGPGRLDARDIVQKWQNRFQPNRRGGMGGPGNNQNNQWVQQAQNLGIDTSGWANNGQNARQDYRQAMQNYNPSPISLPPQPLPPRPDPQPVPGIPMPPPTPQPIVYPDPPPPQYITQYVNPFGLTSDAQAQQYAQWLGLDPSAYGSTSMADYLDLQQAATMAGQGSMGADGRITYGGGGTGVYYPGVVEPLRPEMPLQPAPPQPSRPLPPIAPPRPPDPTYPYPVRPERPIPQMPLQPGQPMNSNNQWVQKAQQQGIDTSGWANNGRNAQEDYRRAMRNYSPATQTGGQQAAYSQGAGSQQGTPTGSYRSAAPTGIRTSAVSLPAPRSGTGAVNRYRQTRGF